MTDTKEKLSSKEITEIFKSGNHSRLENLLEKIALGTAKITKSSQVNVATRKNKKQKGNINKVNIKFIETVSASDYQNLKLLFKNFSHDYLNSLDSLKTALAYDNYSLIRGLFPTNDIESMKLLCDYLNMNDKKHHILFEEGLERACNRKLQMVNFLLLSDSLSNIDFNVDKALCDAAKANAFGVIKSIVESQKTASKLSKSLEPLYLACEAANMCNTKYLFSYYEKEQIELDEEFYNNVFIKCSEKKTRNILEFFINDKQIALYPSIEKFLLEEEISREEKDFRASILSHFRKVDLNRNLHKSLEDKPKQLKFKI